MSVLGELVFGEAGRRVFYFRDGGIKRRVWLLMTPCWRTRHRMTSRGSWDDVTPVLFVRTLPSLHFMAPIGTTLALTCYQQSAPSQGMVHQSLSKLKQCGRPTVVAPK